MKGTCWHDRAMNRFSYCTRLIKGARCMFHLNSPSAGLLMDCSRLGMYGVRHSVRRKEARLRCHVRLVSFSNCCFNLRWARRGGLKRFEKAPELVPDEFLKGSLCSVRRKEARPQCNVRKVASSKCLLFETIFHPRGSERLFISF